MALNGDLRLFHLITLTSCIKANSADPDQTPRFAASDLGMHCLLMSQSRFYRYPCLNCTLTSQGQGC